MATTFRNDESLARLGADLISMHHKHLLENGVRVEFLFRDDTPKSAGKEQWGVARKITNLNAFLAGEAEDEGADPFFCIVISEPIWTDLTNNQRLALLDHELCHCWAEEDKEGAVKLTILGHDLEEFGSIVERYGLWREDVKLMARSIENAQLRLTLDEAA